MRRKGSTNVSGSDVAILRATSHAVLQINVIGDFSLIDTSGACRLPSARKARAIAAYLILAEGRPVSRRKLMALTWSERGDDQARASLRQALYDARALCIGDTPLLRVDRGRASADPARFHTDLDHLLALAGGDDAASLAAALPARLEPLLADLDGVDPAFDEWLLGERARRRQGLRDAIATAAARALDEGALVPARALAIFLADEEPFDEPMARLAMICHSSCGDRVAVHHLFERLASTLKRELGIDPELLTIATYRRLMAGSDANAQKTSAALAPMAMTAPPVTVPVSSTVRIRWRRRFQRLALARLAAMLPMTKLRHGNIAVGVAVLLALAGGCLWSARTPSAGAQVVAFEPLQVRAGDAAAAEAVQIGLSDDLARAAGGQTRGLTIAQIGDPGFDRRSAEFVLTGTAAAIDGQLHVRMRLLDAVGGDLLWSSGFEGRVAEPEEMRAQIVTRVGNVLPCVSDTRSGDGRVAVQASRLYLKACEDLGDLDGNAAVGPLRQVTTIAPRFGKGWAALGFAQALSGNVATGTTRTVAFAQARANARRALALDPRAGRAYHALASILPQIGSWRQQMKIIDKGLAADPDNADLYSLRGSLLDLVGRWHEGDIAHRRALDLNPSNPYFLADVAASLALHGRLDEGEQMLERAAPAWRNSAALWQARFMIDARLSDPRRALAMLDDPARPAMRARAEVENWKLNLLARDSPTPARISAAARKIAKSTCTEHALDPLLPAHALAALGRTGDAYRVAFSAPPQEEQANELLFRSYMATFRADRRFMTLARQRGLVAIWQATERWPDFCGTPGLPYDCHQAARSTMAISRRPLRLASGQI